MRQSYIVSRETVIYPVFHGYNMIVPQGTDCRRLKMSHIDMAEIGVTPERVEPMIGYILEYKEFNGPLAFF